MTPSRTLNIGLAVHQDATAVASVAQAPGAEVLALSTIGTRPGAIDALSRQIPFTSAPRLCVYEAGPCGDGR